MQALLHQKCCEAYNNGITFSPAAEGLLDRFSNGNAPVLGYTHYADVDITPSGCPRRWFRSVGTSRSEHAVQDRTSSSVGGIL